jgi:O-antigen ligase
MWKSGLVWVQSYPLFGTGPGTIKEMYPTFRRTDYGRLEGGQNFTPDKLHNEYINVMATNGYTGFILYFLWLLPAFIWILVTTISRNENVPSTYLIIGLLGGCFVYWGQTFFNFGVVATKGLFYELMGLTLAIVIMNPWRDFKDTIPDEQQPVGAQALSNSTPQ